MQNFSSTSFLCSSVIESKSPQLNIGLIPLLSKYNAPLSTPHHKLEEGYSFGNTPPNIMFIFFFFIILTTHLMFFLYHLLRIRMNHKLISPHLYLDKLLTFLYLFHRLLLLRSYNFFLLWSFRYLQFFSNISGMNFCPPNPGFTVIIKT